MVLVSNGVYATGGRALSGLMTNRVAVTKPLTLQSVNGPQVTSIIGGKAPGGGNGNGAVRCVYLIDGTSISGFTLTNGATRISGEPEFQQSGGGLWCESPAVVVSNCVLISNSANANGGGAYRGTLDNCTLSGNSAYAGGGAASCTLNNCTVSGNSAQHGGGVYFSSLNNCIVYFNTAIINGSNYLLGFVGGNWNYCCTSPLPVGPGNIDLDPLFIDTNDWSNLRLQSNSPCINAGNNADVISSTDLDGRPRIVGGTVDMGAYEFQGPGMSEFIGWLAQYHLPTDGSADTLDTDLDGHNAWQEWKAWTDPTNALSVLKLLTPQPDPNGVVVSWQSVLGHSYLLERATNANGPFSLLQGNISGQSGTTSVTDTNPANGHPILYRVAVPE